MGFAGEVGDELEVEADAEGRGMRRARGEQAVVVAAAATEAASIAGESEAGDEDEVEVGDRNSELRGGGFADEWVPGGGGEVFGVAHDDELDLRAGDARVAELAGRFLPEQLHVGLSRERGEKGNGLRGEKRRVRGEGGDDGAGIRGAGVAEVLEAGAQGAAEVGLRHGAKLNGGGASLASGGKLCLARGQRYNSRPVPNPFQKRKPKADIKKSATPNGHGQDEAARKVGLKPGNGWQKRNFLTEVLIPSIFEPRAGGHAPPNFPELREGEICITWTGHASFLIQTREQNLLIDPNWAKWLKVFKRMKHPGLRLDDLPAIDLVLVTHAHFDHLDRKTLRGVAADQPIVVPFEVGNLVHDLGFRSVHELHYWESYECGPAKITLTPAHHWGARVLHDTHRGFGGFIIEVGGRTIFHCGDTAYFEGFREIGARHAIDVALLPIGAYDPPSGREVHMNPEEALRAFVDLGARRMVPMHYGTFRLSYEPLHEPPERLLACAREQGLAERITIMTEGEPLVF